MFYIYGLREVGSDEYRYVGHTNDCDRRRWAHMALAKDPQASNNEQLYKWMAAAGNFKMDVLQTVDSNPRSAEEIWINKLRAAGDRLLNARSATRRVLGMAEMDDTQKRHIISSYLDRFEDDTDTPWLKEDDPVYTV